MALNAEQLMTLTETHHRGQRATCPVYSSILQALEMDMLYSEPHSVGVHFSCPRCGVDGTQKARRNELPWTTAQQASIVDTYWRQRGGFCPNDNGRLRFLASTPIGGAGQVISHCPICGAMADSRTLGAHHAK